MARFSVYVADDLLERVRALDSQAPTSQLVQRAFQCLLDGEGEPVYVGDRPAGAAERIREVREKLVAEAREEYGRGYAGALEAADKVPWRSLDGLAEAGFDVRRWIKPYVRGAEYELVQDNKGEVSSKWLWDVARVLGTLADPIGFDEFSFTPTRALVRGFADGMRDVWAAVEHGTSGAEGDVSSHEEDA